MSRKAASSNGRGRARWGAFGAALSGILLFMLAVAGGIELDGLVVHLESGGAQVLVSAVGVSLLAAAVLLLADDSGEKRPIAPPKTREETAIYQIKMLRPARYQRRMEVEGWFVRQPPEGALRLFTVEEDGRFRPQSIAVIDEEGQHWSGEVDLGPGPYYAVTIVAALVEDAGAALWEYYYRVGSKSGWEAISGQLDDFAAECDRFLVQGTVYE